MLINGEIGAENVMVDIATHLAQFTDPINLGKLFPLSCF